MLPSSDMPSESPPEGLASPTTLVVWIGSKPLDSVYLWTSYGTGKQGYSWVKTAMNLKDFWPRKMIDYRNRMEDAGYDSIVRIYPDGTTQRILYND